MKRLLALLLVLTLLGPTLPGSTALALDEDTQPVAASTNDLLDDLELYGSVDAAMLAYVDDPSGAKRQHLNDLLAYETMTFRLLADHIEGEDDDPHRFTRFLLEIGYAEAERNGNWAIIENQIAQYLYYLMLLTKMDADSFSQIKEYASEYIPERDMLSETIDYAQKLLIWQAGKAIDKASSQFRTQGLNTYRANRSEATFFQMLDCYESSTSLSYAGGFLTASDIAKGLNAIPDPVQIKKVTDAHDWAVNGMQTLLALAPSEYDDPYYYRACLILYDAYQEYAAQLKQLSADPDAAEKLKDDDYLDKLFEEVLAKSLEENTSNYMKLADSAMVIASTGVKAIADYCSGGWGTVAFEGMLYIGELFDSTKSMYTHLHGISVLNEIYQGLEKNLEENPLETWEDWYEYYGTIKRMCNVAMLGESHMYEIGKDDAPLEYKLYAHVWAALGIVDDMEDTENWYQQRMKTLENTHETAEWWMAAMLQRHAEFLAVEADMAPYLGHEDESVGVIRGSLSEEPWYAKTDGSGEPDKNHLNPNYGTAIDGVTVCLLADGVPIAQADTNKNGDYTITYDRIRAEGKELQLQFGGNGNGRFAIKTKDAGRYASITFPASFGWDPVSQNPDDASTWSATVQVPYSDQYFVPDASQTYSQELALASLGLSAASMSRSTADGSTSGSTGRDANIRSALGQMGFESIVTHGYDANLNDVLDEAPYALATRYAEDADDNGGEPTRHRIVVLTIGGDVDVPAAARLWFDEGAMLERYAEEIAREADAYIASVWNPGEELHLWLTGFSWGGTLVCAVERYLQHSGIQHSDATIYTFAAPGQLSSTGYHLVYEQDLIGRGLFNGTAQHSVFGNVASGSAAQQRITSVFNELTYGNAPYSPSWYEADVRLAQYLQNSDLDDDTLCDLFASLWVWNFVNGTDGTDFRLQEPDTRSNAVQAALGLQDFAMEDLTEVYAKLALDQAAIPLFETLGPEMEEEYQQSLADVFAISMILPDEITQEQMTQLNDEVLPLLLLVDETLHNPTRAKRSIGFAHRPEMYFAWLLGTNAQTLLGQAEAEPFCAELLPLPVNLMGTVLDATTHKPIIGAKVTITAADATQINTSDTEGKWDTYVEPADYRITFECSGYKTVTTNVPRTMFGDEAVMLETLMVAELPYLTAYIDKRSTGPVQALTEDGECPAGVPEITLSMTLDRWNNADSITITHEACAEPLTYFPVSSSSARLFAVDMGNGSYTYVLNAYCNGTGGGSYVVVFRVVNGEFVIIKELVSEDQRDTISVDAAFLDDSACTGTIHPTGTAFKVAEIPELNEDRTGKTLHDAGLGTMRAELREDGYYDLVFSLGTYCIGNYDSIGDVCTRYTMIDDELVMESQWFHPYEGVLVSDQSDEIEVCTVSREDACYLYRARLPGNALYGYVDIRNGKFAIRPQFVSCDTTFSNNSVAIVYNELNQCNVINEKGEKLFEDGEIVTAMEFYDDHCLVVQRDMAHCYLYDAHGNELTELKVPVADVVELWPSTVNLGWSSSIYGRWNRTYVAERYILLRAKDQSGTLTEHWLNEKGEVLLSTSGDKIPGSLAGDESGYYYFYRGRVDYLSPDTQHIQSKSTIGEIPAVNWDGDNWYARGYHAVYTNGMRTFTSIGYLSGSFDIDANDGVICTEGFYFSSDGTELNAPYLHGSASYYRNGYVEWEEGYGDASGNIAFAFPEGTDRDDFSVVFQDGYYFQKEGALYSIKNIDGTVICDPTYSELGYMN